MGEKTTTSNIDYVKALEMAEYLRQNIDNFYYGFRTRESKKSDRISKGYFFTGDDTYVAIPIVKTSSPTNKTRSIIIFYESSKWYIHIIAEKDEHTTTSGIYDKIANELSFIIYNNGEGRKHNNKYIKECSNPAEIKENIEQIITKIKENKVDNELFTKEEWEKGLQYHKDNISNVNGTLIGKEIFIETQNTKSDIQTEQINSIENEQINNVEIESKRLFPLNMILYGPPGTGKTFNTVNYAVAIVENKTIEQIENEVQDKGREIIKERYDSYIKDGQIVFTTFHQSMSYEDFIEGIKPQCASKIITYSVENGIFRKISTAAEKNRKGKTEKELSKNYVIIIDEINRGNVSQIFGELITLIEEDKRLGEKEATKIVLPYSSSMNPDEAEFGIPNNLYIIGTMNTADRSVEALDSALRRRFTFYELMPKSDLIKGKYDNFKVADIHKKINERIVVLKGREYQIGHSYFMKGSDDDYEYTDDMMKDIFLYKVIPLLQEYFFGDYEKIQWVLGEGFIEEKKINNDIFAKKNVDFDVTQLFELKKEIDIKSAINTLME